MIKRILAGFVLMFLTSVLYAAELRIKAVQGEKEQLVFSILKLVLSKSLGEVHFLESHNNCSEARLLREVEAGRVDIMWAGADKERDKRLRAIRIPVLKGLLGHRVFIIRKEDQQKFRQIRSLNELKTMHAGQGAFWGDTPVLKNAGLPVTTSVKYSTLFPMLDNRRFDYFPRAVHEPWVEIDAHPSLDLTVDNNVLLVYPFAMHFYVNKSDQKLYDAIQQGFETAIADGSFDRLFFNHSMIRDIQKKAQLSQRRVFHIDNPFLHPDTPRHREELWLDLTRL